MKVWITRDNAVQVVEVFFWKKKPYKDEGRLYPVTSCREPFWITLYKFKKLFGFTPRKGTCKQYDLTLKEIK